MLVCVIYNIMTEAFLLKFVLCCVQQTKGEKTMDYTTEQYEAMSAATNGGVQGLLVVYVIAAIVLCIIYVASMWKLFTKAGEAGWKSLIPIYDVYILFKIVYGNGLKFLFLIIPVLNVITEIAIMLRLAKVYGKGAGFGVALFLFSPIALPVLAFGKSEYEGPVDSFI